MSLCIALQYLSSRTVADSQAVSSLTDRVQAKEDEITKLSSEKDELEASTKKALTACQQQIKSKDERIRELSELVSE